MEILGHEGKENFGPREVKLFIFLCWCELRKMTPVIGSMNNKINFIY